MQFFFALFLQLLTAATPVHAANLFAQCGVATSWCESTATCVDTKPLGLNTVASKVCLPHRNYASCLNGKTCPSITTGCFAVSDLKGDYWNRVCLENQTVIDNGSTPADSCQKDSDCVYQTGQYQCIRVTAHQTTGVNKFVSVKKCIDVIKLPANLVSEQTNSCGSNASCQADESCVQNVYEPSALASFVCYNNKNISSTACSNVGTQCKFTPEKTGLCMNVIKGGKKNPQCIDPELMPGGPNAPSTQQCNDNSDCKSQAGFIYCLKNPITLKNNCFSQQTIITDMAQLPKQLCNGADCSCKLPGVKSCDPSGKESVCAEYVGSKASGISVCISFVGSGTALGSGSGTPTNAPEHLKPDVAQQTYEMYAPKLQIDIPNLSFTGNITALGGPDGMKEFSVPYIATYINAVYKYSIGLGVMIAILTLMYAGFRWMTSFGDAKAVSEAKTAVGNSVFGLFLLFSAFTILYVINPDLIQLNSLKIFAPEQVVFENLNEEELSKEAETTDAGVSASTNTGKEACLLKYFAPGKTYGDKPDVVGVKLFGLKRTVYVNKYTADAWKKVSAEIMASTDPEVRGILRYMSDFEEKKVPDMTGKIDGKGASSVLIKCIGCDKKGNLHPDIGHKYHAPGLAADFMTRSGWAIKWGPKQVDTSYCPVYKETLEKMMRGDYGEFLKSDPYLMYNRLKPLAESCVNKFNNGKWTIWPKKFVDIFEANGFIAGEKFKGLYTDGMHFEYHGPCKGVK